MSIHLHFLRWQEGGATAPLNPPLNCPCLIQIFWQKMLFSFLRGISLTLGNYTAKFGRPNSKESTSFNSLSFTVKGKDTDDDYEVFFECVFPILNLHL